MGRSSTCQLLMRYDKWGKPAYRSGGYWIYDCYVWIGEAKLGIIDKPLQIGLGMSHEFGVVWTSEVSLAGRRQQR